MMRWIGMEARSMLCISDGTITTQPSALTVFFIGVELKSDSITFVVDYFLDLGKVSETIV